MEKKDAYLVGKALGRVPLWVYAATAAALIAYAVSQQSPAPAKPTLSSAAVQENTPTAMCARERAERLMQYEAHMQAGKPWQASNTIRRCAILLADVELKALTEKAEQAEWLQTAKNATANTAARISAIDKLLSASTPPTDASLAPLRAKLDLQLKREIAAEQKAEAARKKREGVTLGMTPEEVLASSWGKPIRVNRSVYSFGVHEQWVYHGSNYLYFRDGKLNSLQTGQ